VKRVIVSVHFGYQTEHLEEFYVQGQAAVAGRLYDRGNLCATTSRAGTRRETSGGRAGLDQRCHFK
jgi:hypothetical protein